MQLSITGLSELRDRLERVRASEIMATALAAEAERMAQAVRDGLSQSPGGGEHDKPWRRTGALHDSIQSTANGLEAAIGSSDPAAAPQEQGTIHLPPRPFLAPVAAQMGESVGQTVANAVATALQQAAGTGASVAVNATGGEHSDSAA